MAEKINYIQYFPCVDRIDYLAGFFYSQLLCDIVEKAMNVKIKELDVSNMYGNNYIFINNNYPIGCICTRTSLYNR